MKKLIIVALAFMAFTVNAQDRKMRHDRMSDYSPEEIAELQTKRMTLNLDLTEAQQQKVAKINLKNAKKRQEKMQAFKAKKGDRETKLTKEERLKIKHDFLDSQIETKRDMREVLNDDQYEKWTKSLEHKKRRFAKRDDRHKRK
ncbi:hypothetical protein [Mangrovimonas cancribranchiae]|uniref:LTXXQ motif family protein n=1 Tax=Mangrovimonas cancribranchiae TaxID=3080055 RepID=A0AAU6P475_9FLAO